MNIDIEEMLYKQGEQTAKLKAPPELEERLKAALTDCGQHKVRQRYAGSWAKARTMLVKSAIAAAAFLLIFVSFNFDTLAFYGKKIVGYDSVLDPSISKLNEIGMGQTIGESCSFGDNTRITMDGLMMDDNQLILMYTQSTVPGGMVDEKTEPIIQIRGFYGQYNMHSGMGQISEDKTQVKNVQYFDPPFFLERSLKIYISQYYNKQWEEKCIEVKIDRTKAMGHVLKKALNLQVKVPYTDIRFESIQASATKTVVKGSTQDSIGLALDVLTKDRFRSSDIEFELIADGKTLRNQGGGASTDMDGQRFHQDFDPLPPNVKKLQIHLTLFNADHDVKFQSPLVKGRQNTKLNVLGQDVTINDIYESNGDTFVTLTTEKSVVLTRVRLLMDSTEVKLEETLPGDETKTENGQVFYQRTLHFKGTADQLALNIKRITFAEKFDKWLDIPVD